MTKPLIGEDFITLLPCFYLLFILFKIIRPTIADIAPMTIGTIYFIINLNRLPLLNTNFRLQRANTA